METLIERWKNSRSKSFSRTSPRSSFNNKSNASIEKPKSKFSSSSSSSSFGFRTSSTNKFKNGNSENLKKSNILRQENSPIKKNLHTKSPSLPSGKKEINLMNSEVSNLDSMNMRDDLFDSIKQLSIRNFQTEDKENDSLLEISKSISQLFSNKNSITGSTSNLFKKGKEFETDGLEFLQNILEEMIKPFRNENITLRRKLNNSSLLLAEKRKEIERNENNSNLIQERDLMITELERENQNLKSEIQNFNSKVKETVKIEQSNLQLELIEMLKANQKTLENNNKVLLEQINSQKIQIENQEKIWDTQLSEVHGILELLTEKSTLEDSNSNLETMKKKSFGRLKV